VHQAHPLGLNWGHRRRKDDVADATDLVDMLRLGRLPEAWIAPPACRELRELVRYRAKLVCLRSGLKAQVHAVLAKEGVHVPVSDLFGVTGQRLLDEVPLRRAYTIRVESLRDLIEVYDREVDMVDREVRTGLAGHPGWAAIQAIPGVGPVLGAVFAPRSTTSTASRPPVTCARGPGSRRRIASPTPPSSRATSPSRGPGWCAGLLSRRPRRPAIS
jgi:transposase